EPEVPAAPELNSASAGVNKVDLGWSSVENANGYKLKYGTNPEDYTEEIDLGTETSYTVTELKSDKKYYFVVTSYNDSGESENSNVLDITTMSEVVPEGLAVQIEEVTAQPGETVTVPVKLINVEEPINACDFQLEFDNSELEIVELSAGDITKEGFNGNFNNERSFMAFLFMIEDQKEEKKNQEMIREDGVFANLKVKVKSDASEGLKEINFKKGGVFADFDQNQMPVEKIAGGIVIE
ncbi:MAG: cohesin domain-containing protein, partial [Bacillota bacterium]